MSLVMEVDQGLARELNAAGVKSATQLLASFDVQRLSGFTRPWGDRQQRVGKKAEKILVYADVLISGNERMLGAIAIPAHDNYVMFDLEGMPPQLDDLEKIYLWGMQVYGKRPSAFMGVTAGFGPNGDQEGWAAFLDAAQNLFADYGDIPFVHWHHYEKTHINQYIARYGDPDGTAARVLRNLLDLLPVTKNAIALPLPSYSLKVVEEYVGYKRTQDEYGGTWAMAQFILATETADEAERNARMAEILKYRRRMASRPRFGPRAGQPFSPPRRCSPSSPRCGAGCAPCPRARGGSRGGCGSSCRTARSLPARSRSPPTDRSWCTMAGTASGCALPTTPIRCGSPGRMRWTAFPRSPPTAGRWHSWARGRSPFAP